MNSVVLTYIRTCVFHLGHDNVTEKLLGLAHHLEDTNQGLSYLILAGRVRERERERERERDTYKFSMQYAHC